MVEVDEAVVRVKKENISPYKARFRDASWFNWINKRFVLVLGAGGIGSWTSLFLARAGAAIMIQDMDEVSEVNMAGQFFPTNSITKRKVDVCKEMNKTFCDTTVAFIANHGVYTADSPTNQIVFAGFDNMSARKIAFENWVTFVSTLDSEQQKDCVFIDGRLLAEDYQVYIVRPGQEDRYRKTLFADSVNDGIMCTLKSTTHCAAGIASEITAVFTNFATNRAYDEELRVVPFSIVKSIQSYTYTIDE